MIYKIIKSVYSKSHWKNRRSCRKDDVCKFIYIFTNIKYYILKNRNIMF